MPGIQPSFSYSAPALEELKRFPSKAVSKVASNIARRHWVFLASAPDEIKEFHSLHVHEYGVGVGAIKKSTTLGRLKRLSSERFWLTNLNRILDSEREKDARRQGLLGSVEKGKMPYCSDATIEILKAREKEIEKRLELSPRKNLADIYRNSTKATFNKSYLQAKAMDVIAQKHGMKWVIITLTCPPEYHSNSPYFDGSGFDEGQRYLQKVLGQIGKAIGNAGYKSGKDYKGVRVLEVHKDGTPHWHILYYYNGDLDKVIEKKLLKIYSRERTRPKQYFNDHLNEILLRAQPESESSQDRTTTPAISYLFKKVSYAFRLQASAQTDDVIRHRYAIKAARARQIQTFGVQGYSTKTKALRKGYDKGCLPESLSELAAPLKIAPNDPGRKEKQLQSMVAALEGSLDHLKLLSENVMNRFGESVSKVTHIQSMVNQEITCIYEAPIQMPDNRSGWKGGVNINDSSFSCGCEKCDEMLAARCGIASIQEHRTAVEELEFRRDAGECVNPRAQGSQQAQDRESYDESRHPRLRPHPGGCGLALRTVITALQAIFRLRLRSDHTRLKYFLVMCFVLILASLTHGILAKNYQAHCAEQWSQPHRHPGTNLGIRNSPILTISHFAPTHGVRDPP